MTKLQKITSISILSLFAITATHALPTYAAPPPPATSPVPPPPEQKIPPPPATDATVPPAPVGEGTAASNGKLQLAEQQYKEGKYQEAAIAFQEVANTKIPGDTPRAQFWLGKALYNLEFYASSFAVFSEIVDAGPSHPYYKLTLAWLASLSKELPEGAGVLEKVGAYKPQELEDQAFDEVRDELYYLLGRYFYQTADLNQAISLFMQVGEDSEYYIPAQYFIGVAETRELHGTQAVDAFKNVLRKNIALREQAEKNKKQLKKEERKRKRVQRKLRRKGSAKKAAIGEDVSFEEEILRYEERANLSLGYIFYQVGKFETALKYFDKIPQESPYWLDSILASAWAEFRLVEVEPENANIHYQRTLGYIHTINAPFFYDYLYPESLILKAVTYYFNCRYEPSKRALEEFNRRYPSIRNDLKKLLSDASEDFALFELSVKIRDGKSGIDPFVEEVARKSLQDKTLEKNYGYVKELEREVDLLTEMSGNFRSSGAGERIQEDLDTMLSLAKEATGALARERLLGQIKEINDLEREAIKIEYEILNRLKGSNEEKSLERRPARPKIDSEHEIYNYNGEYWKDELGYYNYKVTSLCQEE